MEQHRSVHLYCAQLCKLLHFCNRSDSALETKCSCAAQRDAHMSTAGLSEFHQVWPVFAGLVPILAKCGAGLAEFDWHSPESGHALPEIDQNWLALGISWPTLVKLGRNQFNGGRCCSRKLVRFGPKLANHRPRSVDTGRNWFGHFYPYAVCLVKGARTDRWWWCLRGALRAHSGRMCAHDHLKHKRAPAHRAA